MVGKAGYMTAVNANVENNYQYLKLYIKYKAVGHPSLLSIGPRVPPTRSSDVGLFPDTTQGDCLLGGSSLFHPLEERWEWKQVNTVQARLLLCRVCPPRGRRDCQVHIPGSRGRQARWRL